MVAGPQICQCSSRGLEQVHRDRDQTSQKAVCSKESLVLPIWQRYSVTAGTVACAGVAAAFCGRFAAPFFVAFREAFTGAFFVAFFAVFTGALLPTAFLAAFLAAGGC